MTNVDELLANVAARRVRTIGSVVAVSQIIAFITSAPAGFPLERATIIYNAVSIPALVVIAVLALLDRLPLRLAPTAATIVWCGPVGGTLLSQYQNGQAQLVIVVLIELACLAMLVDTRFVIAAAATTVACYVPLVIRDAEPVVMHVSVVLTAAVFGVMLQLVTRRSLVRAELHRMGEAEAAAELERKIAELERSERECERLQERLLHVQRLEAVGTLAAGIAHDMNNVLAGITSYANILGANDAATAREVQPLIDQALRGAELTRGLLAFSRRGQYRKVRVQLSQLVEETSALVKPSFPAECQLVVVQSTGTAQLEGDPVQLRQVIVNLCVNAADAMPNGGVVVLASDRVTLEEQAACEHGLPPGPYVRFHVADSGTGIDDATRRRMFEPFFTTKPVGKGTGLGLALVWGVVQAHGGAVHVETELGSGTRFSVLLPEAAATVTAKAPVIQTSVWPGRVLVVDDEAAVRNGTTRVLQRRGYQVLTAADGEEALRVFDEHADEIGLVILDMGMPVMGGAECFARLRERADVPVLIATGYAMDAELQSVLAGGASLIEKPFDARALLAEVSRLMRQGAVSAPSVRDSESEQTPT
ncbi:MAG TPA: response regulator [Kofleriaceae bacterium]|nr:response regulator [Kofleriaceae bacterium]